MKREIVLLWGNGEALKKNIVWIKQIYEIAGITGADVNKTDFQKKIYTEKEAIKLSFEKIIITSVYYEEIKDKLIRFYHVHPSKIMFFMDEFKKERRMSFGEKNKDIVFFIWRIPYAKRKNGFMNFLEELFGVYYFCEKRGYEVLVDMKNYYSEYGGIEKYGHCNVWEEYFRQPSKYTLDDAYKSRNVILSAAMNIKFKREMEDRISLGRICRGKFKYSTMLKEEIGKEEAKLFPGNGKVLGVIARGTDYIFLKPKGHPIPCDNFKFIKYVKDFMKQHEYQYIYLATEDLEIYQQFVEAFPEKYLLFSNQKRVSENENRALMDIKLYETDDGFTRGMEYNMIVAMTAKCDGLIANCLCGAAAGALLLNAGEYSHIKIVDEGIYQ